MSQVMVSQVMVTTPRTSLLAGCAQTRLSLASVSLVRRVGTGGGGRLASLTPSPLRACFFPCRDGLGHLPHLPQETGESFQGERGTTRFSPK